LGCGTCTEDLGFVCAGTTAFGWLATGGCTAPMGWIWASTGDMPNPPSAVTNSNEQERLAIDRNLFISNENPASQLFIHGLATDRQSP
jgi:hypothetical protein